MLFNQSGGNIFGTQGTAQQPVQGLGLGTAQPFQQQQQQQGSGLFGMGGGQQQQQPQQQPQQLQQLQQQQLGGGLLGGGIGLGQNQLNPQLQQQNPLLQQNDNTASDDMKDINLANPEHQPKDTISDIQFHPNSQSYQFATCCWDGKVSFYSISAQGNLKKKYLSCDSKFLYR